MFVFSTGSCTTGATKAFLGVCNGAVWMDGVGIGVHSITSTSFPLEAIGQQAFGNMVFSTGSRTTGAFLGVCNSAVWMGQCQHRCG